MKTVKYEFLKNLFFALILSPVILFAAVNDAESQTNASAIKDKIPVILIHGIGGSDLRQKDKGLFSDGGFPNDVLKFKAGDPQKIQFDASGHPRADTISKTVVAVGFYDVPGGRNITDLSKFLQRQGYVLNGTVIEFFYDFRFSAMYNAEKLGALIDQVKQISPTGQVDIVAHSMGGLIAKAYLLPEENAVNVRNLIFVGTPHLGAPKALKALRYGDNLDVPLIDGCKLKRAVHNMPGMFNLLPGEKYFVARGGYFYDEDDLDGNSTRGILDYGQTLFNLKNGKETKCPLKPAVDVAPQDKSLPLDRLNENLVKIHAVEFHERLDNWTKPKTVKVFNIVGYGVSTLETIKEKDGQVSFGYTTEGDGTVPLWSSEAVDCDYIYYINAGKLKLEHSGMIGDDRFARQIYQTLAKGAGSYLPEMSQSRPKAEQLIGKKGKLPR